MGTSIAAVCMLSSACSGGGGGDVGTEDASVTADAGARDSGITQDAALADSGHARDAGLALDSGQADSALAPDSGPASDSGLRADTGERADTGTTRPDLGLWSSINGTVQFEDMLSDTATVTVFDETGATRTTTVTLADGGFGVTVPLGEVSFVRVDADGYVPRIQGYAPDTQNGETRDFYLTPIRTLEQVAAALRLTVSSTSGIVWIDFRDSQVGGYGAVFTPTVRAPSVTLDYSASSAGAPVVSTTTQSGVPNSELIFVNVPAGGYLVSATNAPNAIPCVPRTQGPMMTPIRWPVFAGVMTQVDFNCN